MAGGDLAAAHTAYTESVEISLGLLKRQRQVPQAAKDAIYLLSQLSKVEDALGLTDQAAEHQQLADAIQQSVES